MGEGLGALGDVDGVAGSVGAGDAVIGVTAWAPRR